MKALIPLLAVFALVGFGPQAKANTVTYSLNSSACSSSCGTGPFGTVQLAEVSNGIKVTITLASGVLFVGTGAGDALGFQLPSQLTTSDITGLTTGYSLAGSAKFSSFGTFNNTIHCDVCGPGASNTDPGPMSFIITKSGITLSSFGTSDKSAYFAADVAGVTGNTGNVGTFDGGRVTINEVPEPMTMSLMGLGLLGLGAIKRFRRK